MINAYCVKNSFGVIYKSIMPQYPKLILLIIFLIGASFPFLIYAETIPILGECGGLNSTDLSTQMAHEVDSRISGVTASDSTKMLWSTRGNGTEGWARSGTVWAVGGATPLDFTGASPWNDYSHMSLGATLISPRHIVVADHAPVVNGSTIIFVDNANNIISRTVVNQIQVAIGLDIKVAVLDSDVPSSIAYYPIVDLSTFKNYWKTVPNTPIVILDQEDKALIKNVSGVDSGQVNYLAPSSSPRSDFDETLIVGDSGNPIFGVIGGRLVLLTSVYTATYSPLASYFVSQINNAMTTLGGGYQVSTLDLSCFTPQPLSTFGVESTTFSIDENSSNGTEVGSVLATGDGESVTYSFTSGNSGDVFAINANTGVITVNDQSLLDYDSTPTYTLTLKAQTVNSSWYWPAVPDYDTTTVVINLTETNEAPSFSSPSYSFTIAENSPSLFSVGSVSATDPNTGQTISYQILSGNVDNAFSISTTTGEITVTNGSLLNYNNHSVYDLVVEATDNGEIPLTTTTSVTINISKNRSSGGGGGGGGGSAKKTIKIPPTDTICRTGDKFSTTTGLPCTSFVLGSSNLLTNPNPVACVITLTLRHGSRGEEVKCLQTKLNILSDGSFGPKTKVAVILFQKLHNLVPDGIVGLRTRGEMNRI